jgi:ribosomal protein S18 acetylase RimI-like enzyme
MADNVNIIMRKATAEEYIDIRRSVGWKVPNMETALKGLDNSLFCVCAEVGGKIVGHGRVVGDGFLVAYIQDIIVRPEWQGKGIGFKIMSEIMDFINRIYPVGATVGLMAAKGKQDFYKKFGFIERPNEKIGAGMSQWIKGERA